MSASITARTTKRGRRFVVRFRLGGRGYPVEHGGSFKTMKEARARRDLVAGEIAAGRNPRVLLEQLQTPRPAVRAFEQWADSYRSSRIDLAEQTREKIESHAKTMTMFADRDPTTLTPADVQTWIAGLGLKASSTKRYLATLRGILDYAGVDPNPARDSRVKLPRDEETVVEPPSARDVEAIILHTPQRRRLPITTLAETGLRIGELCALEWRDVDQAGSRFRIRHGKTKAARRWVAVPVDLMAEIVRETPPGDRTPDRHVFHGLTPGALASAIYRACDAAGIVQYSPHDLRHRWASVQVARGVPITNVAAQLGHSRKSLTLDTYAHVLLDE